ncbi:MAG: glutamine--fructose-6-phosphate transaminase (isomerizing) [Candidatus Poseidoniales archaeon]|nr:MAG: glutamine--fructose-6-phosphate transaminase (isomerizing) [Candidatus Poseidoniales archaeon]
MCGIIGYIGEKPAMPILIDGLRRLEYRGYDSAGVAVMEDTIALHKTVGRIADLERVVPPVSSGTMGIAHTRWATHGGVTEENAHPHMSMDQSIAVVHNGIIENAGNLRQRLIETGIEFRSETDTEVIVHLISREIEAGRTPLEAVRRTLMLLRGTWGIAVMIHGYDEVICARNGSPLVIGIGEGEMYISSDPHPLSSHTSRVIFLDDGDIAVISRSGVETHRIDGPADHMVVTIEDQWGDSDMGDYPHFMLKEIHEQPEAIRQCISGRTLVSEGNARLGGLSLSARRLRSLPHVRLIGCGTALYAAQVGRLAIEHLARVPSFAHVASEFRNNDPVIDPKAVYFAVSQSGETADTLAAVKAIQAKDAEVMGVINVVASSIARQCGQGVYIHSGPEQAVASTKAFTNMVAALNLFALQIGRARDMPRTTGRTMVKALRALPDQVQSVIEDEAPYSAAVELLKDAKSVLFLGRGFSAPVAREGALKLMEIAYIPCLAYPAGEMKHGPIALLEEGSPVVVIAPDDVHRDKTISNIEECKARGARIILIHTEGDVIAEHGDVCFTIPSTEESLSPMLSVVPLQLLAYYTGLALDRDVDRPRNLAKSVTVE